MPQNFRKLPMGRWPKGVSNRNAALKWIYQFVQETGDDSGALYFADDDNTYDIRLFEEVSYLDTVPLISLGLGLYLITERVGNNLTRSVIPP